MAQHNRRNNPRESDSTALTVVQPPRLPMPVDAQALGYKPGQWKALVEAIFPSAKSVHGVMLALDYCKARRLDPFKRVVHVVPMWSSALQREVETVWPGIGELRTTATRTGLWAGNDACELGRRTKKAFSETRRGTRNNGEPYENGAACPEIEFPEWARFTVYRLVGNQRVAFVGPKVIFTETFSGMKGMRVPNDRWRQAPYQMLEKCAMAAALRNAFPEELGDQWAAEEMDGKDLRGEPTVIEDAQYRYVDNGVNTQVQDDDQARDGQDADEQDASQPDLRGWDATKLMEYVNQIDRFLQRCASLDSLDAALADERENVESLPDQERATVDRWLAETRTRLTPARAPDDDIVARVRDAVAAVHTIIDLRALATKMTETHQDRSDEVKAEISAIIDARAGELAPKSAS